MIKVEGVSKLYGTVKAVDDLSFEVKPGHVTGFLGPNGAGKTTTMRIILGLDRPTAGQAAINGRSYTQIGAPLREVGALIDASAVHKGRKAYQHLRFLAVSNGIPTSRVREVLRMVGLEEVANRRVGSFSLGMSQRLGIAGALLGDPQVLLFDEPVNGLDPQGILWIRNFLKALASEGRSVLVSSHLMSEMALTADRLVVIGQGRLIADTTVDELVESQSKPMVKVRAADLERLANHLQGQGATVTPSADGSAMVAGPDAVAIGDQALSLGIAIHELSPVRASLEEAFMNLTNESEQYRSAELHETFAIDPQLDSAAPAPAPPGQPPGVPAAPAATWGPPAGQQEETR